MIAQPFTIDVIQTHKLFYLLDHITESPVEFYRRTPAGDDLFEECSLFTMQNGQLLVAFTHPFIYSANICLVAKQGSAEEIVNLTAWERVVDLYDTDIDNTEQGFFIFCDSVAIFGEGTEWRCDNTLYGPHGFLGYEYKSIDEIREYEIILPLHGVGYLIYISLYNDTEIRENRKNNAEIPCVGLTLSEAFKLLYEWSQVAEEPFNSTESIALKASEFLKTFGFTFELVDNQSDMQVANYIKGNTQARLRPTNIQPNKPELIDFIKKNMAESSLAALAVLYPNIWNKEELLDAEQNELNAGIQRFKEFYQIPEDWEITDTARIIEHCELYFNPTIGPYVHNQLRLFRNKQLILNNVQNNLL